MRTHISLPIRARRAFTLALLVAALALPTLAADMPLAAGSPLAGFSFDDQPLSLPVQQNFQMALLTASTELGRSCGKMEAYGWRMKQTEQQRVDQIFNSTVDRLRAIGYVVETQTPASVSRDVTLFTADRQDKHFMFMWSAGEIGLVMVLCQSTPPLVNNYNNNNTASYASHMPQVHSFPMPGEVLTSELKTPVRDKASKEAVSHFSPVGKWVGSYSCMQGFTGGTLDIASLNGRNFKGSFHFYPTRKNPRVASGSYNVYGQYDRVTHRILINPGKWIKRPRGYADTIIVGDFDPAMHSFSGFFQGITGCTSFEAKLATPVRMASKAKPHKKKAVATPASASMPESAPATGVPVPANAVLTPPTPSPASATGGPPSPGIPVGQPSTAVPPPAPVPAPSPAAPPLAPPPAAHPATVTPALQPPLPTQIPPPSAAPAPTTPAAVPPGQ